LTPGQFPRPPVHEGVGLDLERVGEVDDGQRVGVDGEGGGGESNFPAILGVSAERLGLGGVLAN
jgi:hypothetical protein